MRIWTALLALVLCVSCSAQPEPPPAASATQRSQDHHTHPVSGLKIIEVTVNSANGTHRFASELADTPQMRARGLMFRTELGDDEAMIFPFDTPGPRSFWMKNTPIPLDIVFIGADKRIINIARQTEPYSLASHRSEGAAIAVLELRGGRAEELGIVSGDTVGWPDS